MSIKNFFNTEKEKLKGKTPKEIWEYFLDYYAGITFAGLLALIFIISILVTIFGGKDTALSGILLNTYSADMRTELFEDFPEYAQIDANAYEVDFVTNYYITDGKNSEDIYTIQALMANVAAGNTDFITADWEAFDPLCYQSVFFVDLRTVMPAQMLDSLSDRLLYADNSVLKQIQETETGVSDIEIPDPRHPENMEDPFPVAIDLGDCEKFRDLYPIPDSTICFGIVCTSENRENTLKFVEYLFKT